MDKGTTSLVDQPTNKPNAEDLMFPQSKVVILHAQQYQYDLVISAAE